MSLLFYESYSDGFGKKNAEHNVRVRKTRPTPLFIFACGFWPGAAAVFYFGHPENHRVIFVFAICLLLLTCLFLYVFARSYFLKPQADLVTSSGKASRRKPAIKQALGYFQASYPMFLILCCMFGVLLGAGTGLVYGASLDRQGTSLGLHSTEGLRRFELIEDSTEDVHGLSCLAETLDVDGKRIRVKLYLPHSDIHPQFGEILEAKAGLQEFPEKSRDFYRNKGVVASATLRSYDRIERSDIYGKILKLRQGALSLFQTPDAAHAFLRAVLFGDRTKLDEGRLREDIRAVGLSHLVAVSGSHLVIVSSAVGAVLSVLRIRRPRAIGIQLLFIAMYLVLTGMQISALRAAAMSLVSFSSFFAGRRASSLNALAACVVLIILASPSSLLSISFLLSAISTLGIIVLNPLIGSWLRGKRKKPLGFIGEALSLTLAASIPALPLGAAFFSMVSLISPLANILASPFMTIICIFGLVGSFLCLLFPGLTSLLIPMISFISTAFCELVAGMASLPYAAFPCDIGLATGFMFALIPLIGLWVFWPRLSRLGLGLASSIIAACILLYLLISPLYKADEIIMLDVGQGDAFVIRSEGSAILIDTGNQDKALIEALARHGVYRLDAVLISHADDDHCGSLGALRGLVQVDAVCVSQPTLECECDSCTELVREAEELVHDDHVFGLGVGDRVCVGIFDCEVVWPDTFVDKGGNADSLSILVTPRYKNNREKDDGSSRDVGGGDAYCEQTSLFCGDAEYEQLEAMIDDGRLEKLGILKVGHHGSSQALSEKALDTLSPRIALISSGEGNSYGHPTQETLDLLTSYNCLILRTDVSGDLVCRFTPQGISVLSSGVE